MSEKRNRLSLLVLVHFLARPGPRSEMRTMKCVALVMLMVFLFGVWSVRTNPAADAGQLATQQFTVNPIGCVRKAKGKTEVVLDKQYRPGLLGLDGFSHIYVYWWFDRNDTPGRRQSPHSERQEPIGRHPATMPRRETGDRNDQPWWRFARFVRGNDEIRGSRFRD